MAAANPYHEEGYWVGIDAGSVSLNCVVINPSREIVSELRYRGTWKGGGRRRGAHQRASGAVR